MEEVIEYSDHARKRMKARRISEPAVEAVVFNPEDRRDAELLPDERPAEILIGRYEGRRLKVYVEIDRTPTYVKTVCWTRRI